MVFQSSHRTLASRWIYALAITALAALSAQAGYFDNRNFRILTDETFPADEHILHQAHFWYAIYSEVGEDEGLLHDPFYPELVFRKVRAPGQGRVGTKLAEAEVRILQDEVRAMVAKDSGAWTPEDRSLRAQFPIYWDSTGIILSCDRMRFQRGLKGKFRAGLERSYRYLPLIDSVLAAEGVPSRLKYLPHVESSFYPFAYSKVGAAGMWQFMKSSARLFKLKVTYLVDERRDPHASSRAAARMLAYNNRWLKSWPLAIVAYNHGPGGMAKAARITGTRDLGTILKTYYSNSFGFASKNFYAEFLAASSIAMQADSIYPDLRKLEPLQYRNITLPKPLGTRFICAATGMAPEELEEYNLGLRPATFRGNAKLPKGFVLCLPAALDVKALASRLGGVETGGLAAAAAKASPTVTDTLTTAAAQAAVDPDKSGNQAAAADPAAIAAAAAAKSKPKLRERIRERLVDKKPEVPEKPQPVLAQSAPPAPKGRVPPAPASGPAVKAAAPAPATPAAEAPVPQSAALAAAPPAVPGPSAPERLTDPTLALQASDIDKLAHPMDRFNPATYNLDYTYEKGVLAFLSGPDETLSHYAEWAWVPEKTLRRLNAIRNPKDFRMGRKIKIPLAEDKAKEFMNRREEYYRAVEEDFYSNYYVSLTEPLAVAKGMNLWSWSQEREIPFWLLQKHNPGKSLNALHPGDTLNLPLIETGIRKWGFTRYGTTREYLAGLARFLSTGRPAAF